MADYGPTTPAGFIPFTGYTNTMGTGDAATPGTSGYVQFNGNTQDDNRISQLLAKPGNRKWLALFLDLIGDAEGDTVTSTYKRVTARQAMNDQAAMGGVVAIETVTVINRASTSADEDDLILMVSRMANAHPDVFNLTDAGGNGGGGKIGF